jgi:hypothetical protein
MASTLNSARYLLKLKLCSSLCSIDAKKVGGSNRRQLVLETTVDPAENGEVVDMATFSAGGDEVLCYATSMGKLCCLDLRSSRPAWELSNPAKFGEGGRGYRYKLDLISRVHPYKLDEV